MAKKLQAKEAFVNLLETIADNKYVLGDRLVEVGVSGPNLEATLAAVAMAQGELGHARLLYNWSYDLKGVKTRPNIEDQTGKAFKGVVKVENWISLIASLYTVSTALDVVLKSILEAGNERVVTRMQKLINEQKEHIIYSRSWAKQLLNDQGAVPVRFKQSLKQIVPEVEAWLKQVEQQTDIVQNGFITKNALLLNQFQNELEQLDMKELAVVDS